MNHPPWAHTKAEFPHTVRTTRAWSLSLCYRQLKARLSPLYPFPTCSVAPFLHITHEKWSIPKVFGHWATLVLFSGAVTHYKSNKQWSPLALTLLPLPFLFSVLGAHEPHSTRIQTQAGSAYFPATGQLIARNHVTVEMGCLPPKGCGFTTPPKCVEWANSTPALAGFSSESGPQTRIATQLRSWSHFPLTDPAALLGSHGRRGAWCWANSTWSFSAGAKCPPGKAARAFWIRRWPRLEQATSAFLRTFGCLNGNHACNMCRFPLVCQAGQPKGEQRTM